jgi:tRNA/tmRNA/rRNA uracil-C5-methylase (TrmA/RlmC/RlmD family)
MTDDLPDAVDPGVPDSAVGDPAVGDPAVGDPAVGELIRLEVGPVAHGGFCVARHHGRVVFVRHALPGELVLARLTERGERARYWRADAVRVERASPDRVDPPCPHSGPGGCGGCDWQHADLPAQRLLKAAVITEQFARLAGLTPQTGLPTVLVEPMPGERDGLGWRTRVRFSVDPQGRPGLHRHRSHDVLPIDACPIADPAVTGLALADRRWPGIAALEVAVGSDGADPLLVLDPAPGRARALPGRPPAASVAVRDEEGLQRVRGRTWVAEQVTMAGAVRSFRVAGTGFWQVHPAAAQTLLDAVLAAAVPRAGERALDLYGGVGLFAAGVAGAVGPDGEVFCVESDPRAVRDGRRSLHDLPGVRFVTGRAEQVLADPDGPGRIDVVVLDPPRTGAGRVVMQRLAALRPRVMVYVACDPAALARDVATASGLGYRLTGLRAFDAFPMTHHVECVATLTPDELGEPDLRPT